MSVIGINVVKVGNAERKSMPKSLKQLFVPATGAKRSDNDGTAGNDDDGDDDDEIKFIMFHLTKVHNEDKFHDRYHTTMVFQ